MCSRLDMACAEREKLTDSQKLRQDLEDALKNPASSVDYALDMLASQIEKERE